MFTEKQLEFLNTKKSFTTEDASKVGITRRQLRGTKEMVCFGKFPMKHGKGKMLINLWTYDGELAKLAKFAKKQARIKPEEAKDLVDRVEAIVREKLGNFIEIEKENV